MFLRSLNQAVRMALGIHCFVCTMYDTVTVNTEAWQQIFSSFEETSSHMLIGDNIAVIYITFHNFNTNLNSLGVLNKGFC
jgi:hypothetical protein